MTEAKNVIKAAQPHVGIVLLWYPLFTQPFIFREIENLSKILPLEVYTLYGSNLRHCSQEMLNGNITPKTYGAKSIFGVCFQFTRSFFKNPVLIAKLAKRSLWRKWPNIEVFGENLWGFLIGVSLGEKFCEEGIDLVYAPWPRGAATAAWVGASIAGIPFTLSARGDNLEPADPDLVAKLKAALVIRANNMADKQRIDSLIQPMEKTSLIYNSLTLPKPDRNHASLRQKNVRLFALGRFDVTKGFDILLKACSILKKRNIKFTLTLAGAGGKFLGLGNMGAMLENMRRQLNLTQEVKMPGLVSHDQLPEILTNQDIFIAPCKVHESGRRDGIPNTVIEAMAYGLPVISTNVNALPEVVRNNETGLLVEPDDAEALANAIETLINNPELASRLGQNGARLAQNMFDPEKNACRLARMFNAFFQKNKSDSLICAE